MSKSISTFFFLTIFFSGITFSQINHHKSFVTGSVLADGDWYKIATTKDGVYKLSYSDLVQIGALPPFKASDFRLFGNGGSMLPEKNSDSRFDDLIENRVLISDGGDGYIDNNDYVLFYGEGTLKWNFNSVSQIFNHQINYYTDSSYYFFTFDKGAGKRILQYPLISNVPDIIANSFNDHVFYELDSINLLKSGKQWLGEVFNDLASKNYYFKFSDLSDTTNLSTRVNIMSRCVQQSAFTIVVNGISKADTLLPIDGSVNSEYAKSKTIQLGFIPHSDTIKIEISYSKPDVASLGWLNYIELEAVRKLVYQQQQLKFRNIQTIGHDVTQFNFSNSGNVFKIWNIDDSGNICEMQLVSNGNYTNFKAHTENLSEFIAFNENNTFHPTLIGQVQNQNLHGLPQAEFVIVTNPLFLSQANQLADFHRNNDQLTVAVVTTEQVYNEFSSGKQNPAAIRDFVRMFYERGASDTANRVHYLLLFGDGSYDMKHRIPSNTNLVPTWQTDNSILPISSFVSDDFYGMLDSIEGDNLNGDIDVGVGRFPVSTIEDADILVSKSIRYGTKKDLVENSYENGLTSNYDSWRNNICFIADDEDGNLHFKQTEKMVDMLDSITHKLNVNKIYLDAYKQIHTPSGDKYPDVNTDIDKNIKNGTLLLNYIGHGGEYGLASEGILTFYEISRYQNFYNLPVFVTATCEFSRYDDPGLVSGGEKILLHPNGGGIAMFTTTRIAFAHANEIVNRNLLKTAFNSDQHEKIRFGDIIKESKNLCGLGIYKENFTLLGDPALSMAIPDYDVMTEKILIDTTNITGDSIFNNSIITVKGFISDKNGNKQDWFNGKIYPHVYDKPVLVNTLANDATQSYQASFKLQQSLLFEGNSTVKDGVFEFSFFVPRDISFGDGMGKILYYAKSTFFDARGVSDSLLLKNNGINDNPDITGPDIKIYLDDPTFVNGAEISNSPVMYAFLHDTSGINCFGLGIGHEIIGEMDDDFNDPYLLNNYFIQEADKYSSGKITYRFIGLPYGIHKFKLSAWDLLNNHSEKEITFNVKGPSDLDLGGIYNYPDPVYDQTTFYINRNMSMDVMFVKISIFDITGKLCDEMDQNILPGSFEPIKILWNGKNSQGEHLSKGFYTYKVTLSDAHEKIRQKADKMVIVK
jgi:hypothetical protein